MATPPFTQRRHTREDSGIRLDREFTWWHDDEPVEHPRIIELFNISLHPTEDGRFQLQIAKDWCYVLVEDAAYKVTAVDGGGEQPLFLRLSNRTGEKLDLATLTLDADGVLSCRVKQGRAKARFSRDAQFALGTNLEEEANGRFVVHAEGERCPLRNGP